MDALSRATPAMLPEPRKNLPAVYRPPAKPRKKFPKLPWRALVGVSLVAATMGLSAYAYLHRGGNGGAATQAGTPQTSPNKTAINHTGANQTGAAPLVASSNGDAAAVPLPSRRPPARAQQPRRPSVSGSAVVVERHPFLPSGDD